MDQLLCLPEPLTPAKGFSCSRQTRPCRRATFCMSPSSAGCGRWRCWWWRRSGASSYCAGATSLCWVLAENAQLPELVVQLVHEGGDALLDRAEVLVFQLLALGRLGAEERAAGEDQVQALVEELLVDQEVFLLRADRGRHFGRGRVAEQPQDAQRLRGQRVHRAQQRRFLVQRLAGVGEERGRNAQGAPASLRKAGEVQSQAV